MRNFIKYFVMVMILLPLTLTIADESPPEVIGLSFHPVSTAINGVALNPDDVGYFINCGKKTGAYDELTDIKPDNVNINNVGDVQYLFSGDAGPDGMRYCIVRAYNDVGPSSPSGEVSFFVLAGVRLPPLLPDAPSGVNLISK